MLAPSMIISELEKIDSTTSFEGTFGKIEYIGTKGYIYDVTNNSDLWEIPITVAVHAYVTEVKGESVTLRIDVTMTERDSGAMLPDPFSRNSTYVFNKFTLENVKDHSDADKPREGYDPLYPLHLKAGENITNAWLDMLNATAEISALTCLVTIDLELDVTIAPVLYHKCGIYYRTVFVGGKLKL